MAYKRFSPCIFDHSILYIAGEWSLGIVILVETYGDVDRSRETTDTLHLRVESQSWVGASGYKA